MTVFLILTLMVLAVIVFAHLEFDREHASEADELAAKWNEGAYGRSAAGRALTADEQAAISQFHAELSAPYRDEINRAIADAERK